MRYILDRLSAFLQPAAEQWDNHQTRLAHANVHLLHMMREVRRSSDLENEASSSLSPFAEHNSTCVSFLQKKLAVLDSTLDEMRMASSNAALTRLLTSVHEQLDAMKPL